MDRLIFHIDVNSAFLSWEAVRRVSEELPDLRDIPAVIRIERSPPKRQAGGSNPLGDARNSADFVSRSVSILAKRDPLFCSRRPDPTSF